MSNSVFILEPVMQLRYGKRKLCGILEGGYSFGLTDPEEVMHYPLILSLGIQFTFGSFVNPSIF